MGHILLTTGDIDPGHTHLTTGGIGPDHTLHITAEDIGPDPGLGPLTVLTAGLQLEGDIDPTPVTQGPIHQNVQVLPIIADDVITALFPTACRQGGARGGVTLRVFHPGQEELEGATHVVFHLWQGEDHQGGAIQGASHRERGKDHQGGATPAAIRPARGDQRGAPHLLAVLQDEARARGEILERATLIVAAWVRGLARVLR